MVLGLLEILMLLLIFDFSKKIGLATKDSKPMNNRQTMPRVFIMRTHHIGRKHQWDRWVYKQN